MSCPHSGWMTVRPWITAMPWVTDRPSAMALWLRRTAALLRSGLAVLAATSIAALMPFARPAAALAPDSAERHGRSEALSGPDRDGGTPLYDLLQARLSLRSYDTRDLTRDEIGQILWAGHGITTTDRFAHRTIPSAGALYPLELFLVNREGVARYLQEDHALEWQTGGDRRQALSEAALGQRWAAEAPVIVAIVAVPERTTVKYGERGQRYIHMEAGCATQNILLAATGLGLGGTPIGAFRDAAVADALRLPSGWEPLLLIPIGHSAGAARE
jgi:SagB-type dehydrogenase family enzyme